jgi:hypothetical protein
MEVLAIALVAVIAYWVGMIRATVILNRLVQSAPQPFRSQAEDVFRQLRILRERGTISPSRASPL